MNNIHTHKKGKLVAVDNVQKYIKKDRENGNEWHGFRVVRQHTRVIASARQFRIELVHLIHEGDSLAIDFRANAVNHHIEIIRYMAGWDVTYQAAIVFDCSNDPNEITRWYNKLIGDIMSEEVFNELKDNVKEHTGQ